MVSALINIFFTLFENIVRLLPGLVRRSHCVHATSLRLSIHHEPAEMQVLSPLSRGS